jgi:hypothetical protein
MFGHLIGFFRIRSPSLYMLLLQNCNEEISVRISNCKTSMFTGFIRIKVKSPMKMGWYNNTIADKIIVEHFLY